MALPIITTAKSPITFAEGAAIGFCMSLHMVSQIAFALFGFSADMALLFALESMFTLASLLKVSIQYSRGERAPSSRKLKVIRLQVLVVGIAPLGSNSRRLNQICAA